MSFNDLTAKAAAAMKPKPSETSKPTDKAKDSEVSAKEAAPKSKTS